MARKAAQKPAAQPASPVATCPQCRELIGRNYPQCSSCRQVAEQLIDDAWQALLTAQSITPGTPLERELAAIVLEESDQYWWREVEAAMRLTSCPACHGPLGYGSTDCAECLSSSDMHWGRDYELDEEGTMLRNEHALRVMLRGLAQAHRHSQASIDGWRLYLPFVLCKPQTGPGSSRQEVQYAQAIRAWINAGRSQELFACNSIEEMYELTRQGRK